MPLMYGTAARLIYQASRLSRRGK